MRILVALLAVFQVANSATYGEDLVRFNRDIRPLLSDRCYACHGPGDQKADLRLDKAASATEFAILPGDPESSELLDRITSDDPDLRMPPAASQKPAFTKDEVERIRRWIQQGAQYESHWAYIKPTRVAPSEGNAERTPDVNWARNPIDRFVLAKLQDHGVEPAPEADRVTLVRRLYLDLTGLPPTPTEVDEYLLDNRPDAYQKLVDKLLASPRHSERLASWWFDLVRFANTVGYHGDQDHNVLPYRDYVIKSFNDNKPFDQFTIEQLAGDLLPSPDMWQLVATGYNRILQTSHEGGIQDGEYVAKMQADRVRNVSEVWLGTSMGCCECHDHKFDPLSQKDFYAMGAFFADVDHYGSFVEIAKNSIPTTRPPEMLAWTLPIYGQLQEVDEQIAEIEKQLRPGVLGDYPKQQQQLAELKKQRVDLEAQFVPTVITKARQPREVRLLPRGNWMDKSGEVVQPALPAAWAPVADDEVADQGASRHKRLTRLDLAEWIVSPENPLTARVTANRLWNLYFGAGLSRLLIDVGSQGEWPTHPELLDWLAVEFIESGWDLRHLQRLMVTSSAYRQSSLPRAELAECDPENHLLARQGRWRLDAEPIRDGALQAAGLLVHKLGGDYGKPYQPAGYYASLNFPERTYKQSTGSGLYRRSVYTHWQRQFLHPWLLAFDAPTREECTAGRRTSNTPSAALVLLNDPTFVEAARGLATRTLQEIASSSETGSASESDSNEANRLRWAWRQATSREPRSEEVERLLALLNLHRAYYQRRQKKPRSSRRSATRRCLKR